MDSFSYRRTYDGPVKAVLLDWDGTIVDYGSNASVRAITELFRQRGVEVRMPLIRATMGTSHKCQLEAIADLDQVALQWEQIHGCYPTQRDVYTLYRELVPLQTDILSSYGKPIPGALETIKSLRGMGIKIGTTSAYTGELQRRFSAEAGRHGFEPDTSICPENVPSGRPQPWMCLKAAMELQIFPMEALVKIGDTVPDIEEGLNAGMWTVGIAKTGNEVGLTEEDLDQLTPVDRNTRIIKAREKLSRCGAHFVVDSLDEVPQIIELINSRQSETVRHKFI
ncbi:phosphonoacetaldehyde hydrolase [Candidatus Nomurabacteria bacterium]|nr:phosphonoacetaldehyde hydrolase [Candidatus Nomurabacteria bacterium]